jgi:Fuc2NAc and GlcNAc transferase
MVDGAKSLIPPNWPVFLVALVSSTVMVGLVRWFSLRRNIMDLPNERSSHRVPAARGGGLGLLLGLGLAGVTVVTDVLSPALTVALAGVGLVAWIGWRDDRGGASVRLRASVHATAGLLMLPFALGVRPSTAWFLLPVLAAWWIFWSVSAINVVNFIDGVDGMIGLQALVFGAYAWTAAWTSVPVGAPMIGGFGAALAGSALGFLLWNWHPAKIFLGDVGSGALGLFFVLLGAMLMRERGLNSIEAYLPLAPIFLDASVTLFQRWRRGARLTEAHREHLYQRLANEAGWGHPRVSMTYGLTSFAAFPVLSSGLWWGLAYSILVPAVYVLLWRRASRR